MAGKLDAHCQANDVHVLMRTAVSGYGLRTDNLANIVTAYFAVMWMTANQAVLPSVKQVQGLRRQMRDVLSNGATVPADAAQRQRMAESLMYQTVTLIRLRETAQAQGNAAYLSELADSAQSSMARQHVDLRALDLTPSGAVQR